MISFKTRVYPPTLYSVPVREGMVSATPLKTVLEPPKLSPAMSALMERLNALKSEKKAKLEEIAALAAEIQAMQHQAAAEEADMDNLLNLLPAGALLRAGAELLQKANAFPDRSAKDLAEKMRQLDKLKSELAVIEGEMKNIMNEIERLQRRESGTLVEESMQPAGFAIDNLPQPFSPRVHEAAKNLGDLTRTQVDLRKPYAYIQSNLIKG